MVAPAKYALTTTATILNSMYLTCNTTDISGFDVNDRDVPLVLLDYNYGYVLL